ncbi:class I adenylate-forming enzyme family protein [Roseobacter sinensis]|uniref:Acyl--CoA ligase n=1 Tax=Roseobacter sinensis TaxID=2931391 RepID=A0ABT3BCP4_9RHOB|nr:class I adenylate-forming enzyme family protein [Roseobacter sp. WL0113]MCV3270908.1 acyl--CoA ligase [Roseobacter sp. WL0113]
MISVFDEGAPPPCPTPFNLADYVLAAGRRRPERDALLVVGPDNTERWSFAALERAVLGTASGLLSLGLRPGDRVLMRLGNTVDFPLAYLGALAVGLVPVPTSAALTEPETQQILTQIAPSAVLRDPAVASAAHDLTVDLDRLRGFRDLPPADYQQGDPEQLAYVVFTSGTSGRPRAVAHAHRAIWARRMMFDGWYGLQPDDRLLHAGAFNWTYTLGTGLMDPWTVGAAALIPAQGTAPDALPDLLARHKATLFAASPGVYRQVLKAERWPSLPTLRHGLSAGETLSDALAARWRAATGTEIYEAFGMSECSTFISGAPGQSQPAGTLGRPQQGRRIALLGPDGPVPIGVEGTIAVHRSDPGLMLGYLGAAAETAARMQGEWFLTGDHATMTAEGDIAYLGRTDDMMNAGGVRVSPIEVEAVLAQAPGIASVAVTDVQLKADVRVITAFYTAAAALDEAELRSYVRERLAHYKQPRLYIHVPELPLGANGKIRRRALQASFEGQL